MGLGLLFGVSDVYRLVISNVSLIRTLYTPLQLTFKSTQPSVSSLVFW
jgi:hypothetical protein